MRGLAPTGGLTRPLPAECGEDNPCEGLSRHATFSNFGMAFLTLFRVSTGDNWNGIMKVPAHAVGGAVGVHERPRRQRWEPARRPPPTGHAAGVCP